MKIGIWLLENYTPEKGGGFSFYDRFIREIDNYLFNENITIVFIQKKPELFPGLKKTVITLPEESSYENSYLFSFSKIIRKTGYTGSYISNKIIQSIKSKANSVTANYLKENNIAALVYPIQGDKAIENFPFIAINWDIGHLSCYSFPEMTSNGEFEERNEWYKSDLHKALLILCESEAGKNELINYSKIFSKKIEVIPAFSGICATLSINAKQTNEILNKYALTPNNFFFYPAQFWPHKNHFGLLKAFKEFQTKVNKNNNIKLILSGGDKGNIEYIKQFAKQLNITDSVIFPGFISVEEIICFYSNATALVMPTFLGPTNLPLIEARELNCPVLCSDLEGHREMLGNGALYFKPEDSSSIAKAMIEIISPERRISLLEEAKKESNVSKFKIENTIIAFEKALLSIIPIRGCWD